MRGGWAPGPSTSQEAGMDAEKAGKDAEGPGMDLQGPGMDAEGAVFVVYVWCASSCTRLSFFDSALPSQ